MIITKGSTFFILCLTLTALALLTLNCKKVVVENPFTDIATLDCRNLLIRNVSLKDSTIEVVLENTCKTCQPGGVYQGMFMLNRQNPSDTLALSCGSCLSGPENRTTRKYILVTKLDKLPDLNTVLFDFKGLCYDLAYLPK
jgi:hypothetical protein